MRHVPTARLWRLTAFLALVGLALAGVTVPRVSADAAAWTQQTTADPTSDVACATASNCVAVGTPQFGSGTLILISTNAFGGGVWTTANLSGLDLSHRLRSVTCPSASACITVGDGGAILTSTNGFGGGTWTAATSGTTQGLTKVVCPTASACLAVGVT